MKSKKNSVGVKYGSKAVFVRSLPPSTPAKIVVMKAKAAGISITPAYVYNIRTTAHSGTKKGSLGKTNGVNGNGANGNGASSPASLSSLLLAVSSEIGLGDAIAILQSERAKVQSLLHA